MDALAKEDLDKQDFKLDDESNINFQDLEKNDSVASGEAIPNFEPDDVEREGDKTMAAGDVLITDLLERLDDYKANFINEKSDEKDGENGPNEPDEESQLKKKQKLFNLNFVKASHSGKHLTSFASKYRGGPRFL